MGCPKTPGEGPSSVARRLESEGGGEPGDSVWNNKNCKAEDRMDQDIVMLEKVRLQCVVESLRGDRQRSVMFVDGGGLVAMLVKDLGI